MLYRKLGRTGLDVGIIGLGAEHLEHEPEETVKSVVDTALDGGVNYIDLFMPSPGIRDIFGKILKGRRGRVMIAGHLGSTFKDGQYYRTREKAFSEKYFGLSVRLRCRKGLQQCDRRLEVEAYGQLYVLQPLSAMHGRH